MLPIGSDWHNLQLIEVWLGRKLSVVRVEGGIDVAHWQHPELQLSPHTRWSLVLVGPLQRDQLLYIIYRYGWRIRFRQLKRDEVQDSDFSSGFAARASPRKRRSAKHAEAEPGHGL